MSEASLMEALGARMSALEELIGHLASGSLKVAAKNEDSTSPVPSTTTPCSDSCPEGLMEELNKRCLQLTLETDAKLDRLRDEIAADVHERVMKLLCAELGVGDGATVSSRRPPKLSICQASGVSAELSFVDMIAGTAKLHEAEQGEASFATPRLSRSARQHDGNGVHKAEVETFEAAVATLEEPLEPEVVLARAGDVSGVADLVSEASAAPEEGNSCATATTSEVSSYPIPSGMSSGNRSHPSSGMISDLRATTAAMQERFLHNAVQLQRLQLCRVPRAGGSCQVPQPSLFEREDSLHTNHTNVSGFSLHTSNSVASIAGGMLTSSVGVVSRASPPVSARIAHGGSSPMKSMEASPRTASPKRHPQILEQEPQRSNLQPLALLGAPANPKSLLAVARGQVPEGMCASFLPAAAQQQQPPQQPPQQQQCKERQAQSMSPGRQRPPAQQVHPAADPQQQVAVRAAAGSRVPQPMFVCRPASPVRGGAPPHPTSPTAVAMVPKRSASPLRQPQPAHMSQASTPGGATTPTQGANRQVEAGQLQVLIPQPMTGPAPPMAAVAVPSPIASSVGGVQMVRNGSLVVEPSCGSFGLSVRHCEEQHKRPMAQQLSLRSLPQQSHGATPGPTPVQSPGSSPRLEQCTPLQSSLSFSSPRAAGSAQGLSGRPAGLFLQMRSRSPRSSSPQARLGRSAAVQASSPDLHGGVPAMVSGPPMPWMPPSARGLA